MHGIIIGGGIGGLALATALTRVGISFEVHEQADELREVGAGLGLWSNALSALERLGLAEAILAIGSRVDRIEIRKADGQVLSVTRPDSSSRTGRPGSVSIRRADLLREFVRRIEPERILSRSRCTVVEEGDGAVLARFADGRTARGDFLVGADGIHSAVRAQLFDRAEPRYAGYACWRGIADLDGEMLAPNTVFEAWGHGRRFSVHPCGLRRVFWWATCNTPRNGRDGVQGRKADVRELFGNWHEPVPSVIAATPEILRNDIVDRPPIRAWGRGRISLLGDAAHAMTPNLGQGACQAIEDAVVLADRLCRIRGIESALRSYERARRRRTTRITAASRRLGWICQWQNPTACWIRETMARLTPAFASDFFVRRLLAPDLPVLAPERPGSGVRQ